MVCNFKIEENLVSASFDINVLSSIDNAIPISSWFSDFHDTALLDLLPMLDALRFTSDVRTILSRNLHLHLLYSTN